MNAFANSVDLSTVEWLLCLGALTVTIKWGNGSSYKLIYTLLGARITAGAIMYPMLLFAGRGIEAHMAYKIYFAIFWAGFTFEAVISLLIIYNLFNLAMAPLDGIKDMGEIVFRWAGVVSIGLTATVLFVPHPSGIPHVTTILTELQRAQGVLTLCLLLFVCLAIRPLGLTYRSRPFGIVFGLGIVATANLLSSGWLAYSTQMYSVVDRAKNCAHCVAMLLWIVYFSIKEPKRSIVILPTTSPYLRWNQVALALGDPPGFVAIAGVPPEFFAPAELEMLRLASAQIGNTRSMSLDPPRTA